jgi:hypothetical protein
MSFNSGRYSRSPAVLIVGGLLVAASPLPAIAADDGQAPIWSGIGGMIGLVPDKDDTTIQYQEHGKLVLPPKMELPPPGTAPIKNSSAWPVDLDVQKIERAKEARKNSYYVPLTEKARGGKSYTEVTRDSMVTVRANAGVGPATKPCTTGSSAADCHSPGWSPLSAFGLGGKAENESLGPEPDRDWLTDPPKGYRAPSANATSPATTATK